MEFSASELERIKKKYGDLVNEDYHVDLKIGQAREILDIIYNHYKDNPEIQKEFSDAIKEQKERLKKKKNGEEWIPYENHIKDSTEGWLNFLISKEYIPKKFRNNFKHIYQDVSDRMHGKDGPESIIFSTVANLNGIIEWLFLEHERDTKFLKPLVIQVDKESSIRSSKPFFSKWKHLLITITILIVGLFIFLEVKSYTQKQEKIAKEKIIIESANEESKSRAILLSDVYKSIDDEMSDGEKKLSEGLTRKIITLSESLDPYEYIKEGQIVNYSPQRAELFLRLIQSDLSVNDYRKIFKESDFSFSDFSNMNLSNIDLIQLINGLEGQFGMKSQLLITSTVRPNFSSSFFGNCNLTNAHLFGNFNDSDFSGAQIENTFFDWSEAKNANFSNGKMIVHVEHSDFRYSNFKNNVIYGHFKDSDFRGVNFDGSTFYPFDTANNPYLNIKNPVENVFYNGTGEVFNNTFLSSGKSKFRYRFEMLEIEDNLSSYLGRSFFKEEYKTKDESWTYAIIVPIDLLKMNKGKDTVIVDPRFHLIGKDYSQRFFLDEWKNSYHKINNYIVRTNDNYNPDNYEIERSKRISLDNSIQTKVDTMYVFSSKDSYCTGFERESKLNCPDIIALGENEPPASFQNCKFFGSIVRTKIMGVSFKGSHFTNVFFNNSELFNIDMRNTTGNFYLDDVTVLDSVKIDQRSMLNDLKKEKNRLLETKFSFFKDSLSLKTYLQKKKNERIIWSADIQFALNKFRSISEMEKRLFTLNDGKDYYVCDSLYLRRKKLSH